jgi:hypothetical protein
MIGFGDLLIYFLDLVINYIVDLDLLIEQYSLFRFELFFRVAQSAIGIFSSSPMAPCAAKVPKFPTTACFALGAVC